VLFCGVWRRSMLFCGVPRMFAGRCLQLAARPKFVFTPTVLRVN
jgi:hypothetical protein